MGIVEIIPPYLYSMQYDNEPLDEYHRVFRDQHEASFLAEFFRLNAEYLQQPFWKDYFSEPEDAAKDVIVDATALERYINQLADNAKNGKTPDFESYFQPLEGKYIYEWKLKTEVFKRIDQTLAYLKREGITEQEDLKEEDV